MKKVIMVIIFILGFILVSCGHKTNKKKISNHVDLKQVSESYACQSDLLARMEVGILLIDTDARYDDNNTVINKLIKNGKRFQEDNYVIETDDKNNISGLTLQSYKSKDNDQVHMQYELSYDDNKLILSIDAGLYSKEVPIYGITQIFNVDSGCKLSFKEQQVNIFDSTGSKPKVMFYNYITRTNELETDEKEIARIPKYLDLDYFEALKLMANQSYQTLSLFSSFDSPIDSIAISKTKQENQTFHDQIVGIKAAFVVNVLKFDLGDNIFFEAILKQSTISKYKVMTLNFANKITYNLYITPSIWRNARIVVFTKEEQQEVVGFEKSDFESVVQFKVTSGQMIELPNADQYFSNVLSVKNTEDGLQELILQTRDSVNLSNIARMTDLISKEDSHFLMETKFYKLNDPAVLKIVAEIKNQSPRDRLEAMEMVLKKVNELIDYDYEMLDNSENRTLNTYDIIKRKSGVCHHFANLATTLARALSIPAKTVHGIAIDESSITGHAWIEAKLSNDRWIPIEPQSELIGRLGGLIYIPFGDYRPYEDNISYDLSETINIYLFRQTLKVEKI